MIDCKFCVLDHTIGFCNPQILQRVHQSETCSCWNNEVSDPWNALHTKSFKFQAHVLYTQTQRLAVLSICNSLFCWNTQGLGIGQVVRGSWKHPTLCIHISTSGSTSTNSTNSEGAPVTWKHPTNFTLASQRFLFVITSLKVFRTSFELLSNERFLTRRWM